MPRARLTPAADWLWFTACALMFRGNCLDRLAAQLHSRRDALVYPKVERTATLPAEDD